jgi:hypothetical protein
MSEILKIRPWTHVHFTSKAIQYSIEVYRDDLTANEPDQWDFGTNKTMWEQVVAAIRKNLSK